jgi:hypothetical protein
VSRLSTPLQRRIGQGQQCTWCSYLQRVAELAEQALAFGLQRPDDFNQLAVLKLSEKINRASHTSWGATSFAVNTKPFAVVKQDITVHASPAPAAAAKTIGQSPTCAAWHDGYDDAHGAWWEKRAGRACLESSDVDFRLGANGGKGLRKRVTEMHGGAAGIAAGAGLIADAISSRSIGCCCC